MMRGLAATAGLLGILALACSLRPAAACTQLTGSLSDDMLALLNKARKDAGVAPLSFSQELEDEAQQKADELAGGTTEPSAWTRHTRSLLTKHAGSTVGSAFKTRIMPLQASSLSYCPVKIVLGQNMPDWDSSWTLKSFLQAMLDEPVLKKMLLGPSITHMAMAKAGSGEDTAIAIALGQCSEESLSDEA